jgi:hypothetical protein
VSPATARLPEDGVTKAPVHAHPAGGERNVRAGPPYPSNPAIFATFLVKAGQIQEARSLRNPKADPMNSASLEGMRPLEFCTIGPTDLCRWMLKVHILRQDFGQAALRDIILACN